MATVARASHHERQTSSSSSHGPVPGSPTLTNPDMILPDYDPPDSPNSRPQSLVMAWRDPNVDSLDFQLPPQTNYDAETMAATPIIYGNGTMLSDIGEVTEVESTVGGASRRASSRYSGYSENETYGGASAFLSSRGIQRRSQADAQERRSSIDSNSTVTTQRNAFADFDDSVSVDDSNFQGDDEESMASSYVEGTAPRPVRQQPVRGDSGDDKYSTSYISNRAEHILANAKRRLTAMEGNLTRARGSLGHSDGSTPSPQLGRPGSATEKGVHQGAGHARIKSEDGIRESHKQSVVSIPRSASALGAAGGYRPPSSRSKRGEPSMPTSRPTYGISQHPLDTTLAPLSEDGDDNETISNADSARYADDQSSFYTPTFGTFPENHHLLTRSASVAQMRDIQDQMQGLRAKISTLKEQARADSMKRRSLQSLRTPSPFTHARFDGVTEPREFRSMHVVDDKPADPAGHQVDFAPQHANANEQFDSSQDEKTPKESDFREQDVSDVAVLNPSTPGQAVVTKEDTDAVAQQDGDDIDDMHTENGDADSDYQEVFNDAEESIPDSSSESGESVYHDSQHNQMSHEDREDAFDYEHFFLHSAMGSISRQSQRDSSESEMSDSSVETTRGPTSRMSRMSRQKNSIDTNASDETFRTANDGRGSRSSAFRAEMGGGLDGVEELEPLHEVRSWAGGEDSPREPRQRQNSVVYRPTSASQADRLHKASLASLESTGTTRSFPLLNKTKLNGGILTPEESPDPIAKHMSGSSRNSGSGSQGLSAASLNGIPPEDQISVQRLVASLGECVLRLGESSAAGSEARLLRRRIDAARLILEGRDES